MESRPEHTNSLCTTFCTHLTIPFFIVLRQRPVENRDFFHDKIWANILLQYDWSYMAFVHSNITFFFEWTPERYYFFSGKPPKHHSQFNWSLPNTSKNRSWIIITHYLVMLIRGNHGHIKHNFHFQVDCKSCLDELEKLYRYTGASKFYYRCMHIYTRWK